jgi:tRNA modification GTPase
MFDDTIAAIATPLAQSAISIIRLSGEDAIAIADGIFSGNLAHAQSHTIHYGFIKDGTRTYDEVLVSVFRAPKTYTREDVVEINCHGGPYVTRSILQLLLSKGARLARAGEFTQRAFLNGRIDLSQAEAVEDLIESRSTAEADQALYAIRGSIKELLEPLIDKLTTVIATVEVNIDYPEYDDVEELTTNKLLPLAKEILGEMQEILKRSKTGMIFKNGIDTVIAGKPNVGKSSLLNALLEEEKAIVTEIEGTTRDLVEGQIQVGSFRLNLIDTAGIRTSTDRIEQIGIEKSRQMLEKAQLLLLVLDLSRPLDEQDLALLESTEDTDRIVVFNKSDLPSAFDTGEIRKRFSLNRDDIVFVSAKELKTDALQKSIEKRFETSGFEASGSLANDRQIGLLACACNDMINAVQSMEAGMEPDLAQIDLTAARTHLKEILGSVSADDLLDTLFSKFCLGK